MVFLFQSIHLVRRVRSRFDVFVSALEAARAIREADILLHLLYSFSGRLLPIGLHFQSFTFFPTWNHYTCESKKGFVNYSRLSRFCPLSRGGGRNCLKPPSPATNLKKALQVGHSLRLISWDLCSSLREKREKRRN